MYDHVYSAGTYWNICLHIYEGTINKPCYRLPDPDGINLYHWKVIYLKLLHFFFNSFQNKAWFFMCLQYKSSENTVGTGEIVRNE